MHQVLDSVNLLQLIVRFVEAAKKRWHSHRRELAFGLKGLGTLFPCQISSKW